MKRQVVAYIRVSTEDQATHGFSIDTQRKILADYASGHDLGILQEFGGSESAFKPGRPEFQRMIEFLRCHKDVTGVLVYRLDRIARNMTDYVRLVESLGIEIISATEQLPSNASGRLLGDVEVAFATFRSHQQSEIISVNMATKASKGLWPSYAPTGYLNVPDGGIAPDPDRAPLVRRAFEKYARTSISLSGLAQWAASQGLRTRQGGILRRAALHTLLQNPIYCGTIRWAGKLYEGTHEPLISRALFERVQRRMKSVHPRLKTRLYFPYRGFVTCGYCGCQLTAATAKEKYVYYRCTLSKGPCPQPYIREDRLGERLVSVVEGVHLTAKQVEELLELMRGTTEERLHEQVRRSKELARRREKIAQRREAAYEDKLDGRISEERWMELEKKWSQEEFTLKCEVELIREDDGLPLDDVAATLELLERAPRLYLRQNDEERARLLNALAWNCIIDDEKIVPNYKSPFSLVAEGAHSANWYPREDSNL